jgi:hypothetical protein
VKSDLRSLDNQMQWPFRRKEKMVPIGPVVLTNEERQECQTMLRSLTQVEEGAYYMREDLADSFRRSIVALCMIGRAERFLIQAGCGPLNVRLPVGTLCHPEYGAKACEAAAKACGVFPLSIYFYDFGCVLQQVGKTEEAKQMFTEFLRRHGNETLDPIQQITLSHRDVEQAKQHALKVTV